MSQQLMLQLTEPATTSWHPASKQTALRKKLLTQKGFVWRYFHFQAQNLAFPVFLSLTSTDYAIFMHDALAWYRS